jgi:hypothetical protein
MKISGVTLSLSLLLAVLVGVAGYLGVSGILGSDQSPDGSAGGQDLERARLIARLAALEKRVEQLERRPGIRESLTDESVRREVTELMAEARRRDREAEERKARQERAERAVAWYRENYSGILAEARKEVGVAEETWKRLAPVFDRHFEPVAGAVRKHAGGADGRWRWTRVDINKAVAAVLPDTLAALRKGLPPEKWEAFDRWRRQPDVGQYGRVVRGEYFLEADELRKVEAVAATERRWNSLKRAIPDLQAELKLDDEKARAFEQIMQRHAEAFTATFGGRLFVNVFDEENRAKIRPLAAKTDGAVKDLLGEGGFAKYQAWKRDPQSRVYIYFAEDMVRRGGGGDRRRRPGVAGPGGRPDPGPGQPPPAQNKDEVF